jgi:hypothetical protein
LIPHPSSNLQPYKSQNLSSPPTLVLIAKTFYNLKYSDRFYYETNDPDTRFTLPQLDSIRRYVIMKLLINSDINYVLISVFLSLFINKTIEDKSESDAL